MIHPSLHRFIEPIDSIRPHAQNARRGDISAIAASLAENGQYRPLVANRNTGELLAGNQTYAAARMLGWTEVAVVWIEVSETDAKRILLADNKTHDMGGYVDPLLAELIQDILDEDAALLFGTGYTHEEASELINAVNSYVPEEIELSDGEISAAVSALDRLMPEGAEGEAPRPREYVIFSLGAFRCKVNREDYEEFQLKVWEEFGGDDVAASLGLAQRMGLKRESIFPATLEGAEHWRS